MTRIGRLVATIAIISCVVISVGVTPAAAEITIGPAVVTSAGTTVAVTAHAGTPELRPRARPTAERGAVQVLGDFRSSESVDFALAPGARLVEGPHGVAAMQGRDLLFVAWITEGSLHVDGTAVVVDAPVNTEVQLVAGTFLINRVERRSVSQGTTWAVFPTLAGRAAPSSVHASAGWGDIKGLGVPNRRGLYEQYVCHPLSQVARAKSSWNLDSWRRTVGLPATIAAACNPGGGD